jgi:predicted MFS family arabinose efflux permease
MRYQLAPIHPAGGDAGMIRLVLAARALRGFADGCIAVVLPAYLLALGHGELEVGLISTATLFGSAFTTLAIGRWGNRLPIRRLMLAAALLMAATGAAFAGLSSLWPLLLVGFTGTLNPSSGDASVFMPLDHTMLATAPAERRTALFARYSFIGSVFGALGALAAGAPEWLAATGWTMLDALRAMFLVYGAVGVAVWLLYRRLPEPRIEQQRPPAALGPSRGVVLRLAGLFSVDAFAGGLVLNSLLALWLFERFGMSLAGAGAFFFWTGLLAALSQLAAPLLAKRIGLVNTMVFTHIPSSLFLIAAAFASSLEVALGLLLARSLLSQMDVPTRSAFVMNVVTAEERPAAASFTAVPRSLAAAASPSLTGAMFAAGALAAPLVICGVLKIAYDLALLAAFRRHDASAGRAGGR